MRKARPTAVVITFLLALVLACGVQPQLTPPPSTAIPKYLDYRLFTLRNFSPANSLAVSDLVYNRQLAYAGDLWDTGCKIQLRPTVPSLPVTTPTYAPIRVTNSRSGMSDDPWWLFWPDSVIARPAQWARLQSLALSSTTFPFPKEVQIVAVSRIYYDTTTGSNPRMLGGVVFAGTNNVPAEPWVYLAGNLLGTNQDILAHELGHIFALGDRSSPQDSLVNLMFRRLGSTGKFLSSQQCDTARTSPYVQ